MYYTDELKSLSTIESRKLEWLTLLDNVCDEKNWEAEGIARELRYEVEKSAYYHHKKINTDKLELAVWWAKIFLDSPQGAFHWKETVRSLCDFVTAS